MRVVAFFRLKEIRWSLPDAELASLRARFPAIDFVAVEDDDAIAAPLADADVFFGWMFPEALFASARRLRWVHSMSAGIEANLFPALVASDVVLTNGTGLHDVSIPEHALGLMLALARNFHEAQRRQAAHAFDRFGVLSFGGGIRELDGSNLAILGAGPIGVALARRAAALGMRVRVLRRRPGEPVPHTEAVVGPEKLHELLAWADFVVVAVPLTVETKHLIDRAALAAMRASTILVNIGRGESIDDDALVDALRNRAIAGAGLDVFAEEPLPASSPYFELDNVILTPHVSGYTPRYFERSLQLFADNLERFTTGQPLRNVVDKRLGYVTEARA